YTIPQPTQRANGSIAKPTDETLDRFAQLIEAWVRYEVDCPFRCTRKSTAKPVEETHRAVAKPREDSSNSIPPINNQTPQAHGDIRDKRPQGIAIEAEFFPQDNAKRSEEHTSELQSRGNLVCRL